MPQPRSEEEKIDALALRGEGKSLRQIEQITGIPKSTIAVWEKELKELVPLTETYAQNRIVIFRGHQLKVLDSLAKDKLSKVSPEKKVSMLKGLWEMERVEAGKSTSNIGLAIYTLISEAQKRQLEK